MNRESQCSSVCIHMYLVQGVHSWHMYVLVAIQLFNCTVWLWVSANDKQQLLEMDNIHGQHTMTYLHDELEKATTKLEQTERKLQELDKSNQGLEKHPRQRLNELNEEVESLDLVRALALWHEAHSESPTLLQDASQCIALGQLLMEYENTSLLQHVFEKEYQPLHSFVRPQLLLNLRQSLRTIKYPSKEATLLLNAEMNSFSEDEMSTMACAVWLTRLQISHEQLQTRITGIHSVSLKLESVVELCRPIVERVTFHFLQESYERISSTRIDRLPEWLLTFIRETALTGPWEFVEEIASVLKNETLLFQFLNEICQLATYVIIQRNFFRHEKIVGPRSTPILLSGAIEQLLSFDSSIRDLVVLDVYPISLSQLLVAEDEELWNWFLTSERRWALSTLFDTPVCSDVTPRRVSPRAELFSAIIHSIQSKAALFVTGGPYIARVGVPVCQDFLNAIHESSTELRGLLGQRKLLSTEDLGKNLEAWIDLINGTHMAALRLSQGDNKVEHDLSRVGRSMERLRDALVDECCSTLVETVIMERAKLASYLMRCSHMLSLNGASEDSIELSPDLQEATAVFSTVLNVCADVTSTKDHNEMSSVTAFAPLAIRSNVTDRMAEKFLEVALDAHGMTPDITLSGARHFHSDMLALFGDPPLPPLTLRLFDVTRFMKMDLKPFQELKRAISGLVQPLPSLESLYYEAFQQDGTVLDEAISMIRAKGYAWMYLEDVLSILNRRDEISAG